MNIPENSNSKYLKNLGIGIFIFLSIPGTQAYSQKIVTLKECYEKASEINSLSAEKPLYSNIWEIKDRNLAKGWLPTIDANGSFLYNSSVVDIGSALGSLPIPGLQDAIKPLPHEQYKVTVDINQVIYDGGAIKSARDVERADLNINEKQTETDLYGLRSQINSYFFNILLLSRQKALLNNYLSLINKRISSIQSATRNGAALNSDVDVMTSEKIKTEQQLSENELRKAAFSKILGDMTGIEIDSSVNLITPEISNSVSVELSRPELQIFDLRKDQLNASLHVIESKRMPKAFGYATVGYGNPPGSNFFKNEFAPYYILGAGVKWNIFDWNKAKNEKQLVTYQKSILDGRKSDFTDKLNRLLEAKNAEITSLEILVKSDSDLIAIRKRITLISESQYTNGTITATEYLNELISEKQAVINAEIHKINLSMARIEYMNISGKNIE
jgi:outer membrane protein TolC